MLAVVFCKATPTNTVLDCSRFIDARRGMKRFPKISIG